MWCFVWYNILKDVIASRVVLGHQHAMLRNVAAPRIVGAQSATPSQRRWRSNTTAIVKAAWPKPRRRMRTRPDASMLAGDTAVP